MALKLMEPALPSGKTLTDKLGNAGRDAAAVAYTVALAGGVVLFVGFVWTRYAKPKLLGAGHALVDEFGTQVQVA
ncbi:MAG: hypothetical protein QOG31_220 [Thermoplasmata archaeon]|jgi:hypothetical protein|nr:hypothetical protein [Thermoplasmata archaeon]